MILSVLLVAVVLTLATSARRAGASNSSTYTIWGNAPYIANLAVPDPASVEVGVKFRADVAGTVTGIRFFKGPGNTGTHVGDLWKSDGTQLATTTFTNETASGWQQATFATPVTISPGVTYIASYLAPNGHYATTVGLTPGDMTYGADNPPLHALGSGIDGPNGVYAYGTASAFPSQGSKNAANYWVDLTFSATITTPPVASSLKPANGATGAAQNTQITAQFNEEVQPASLSFVLTDPGGATVPAKMTWELHQADRAVTLDPVADLAPATKYTATLAGGTDYAGNVMAPVTWSFTTVSAAQPPPSTIGQWQPVQKWPLVAVHAGVLRTGGVLGLDPQSPVTTSQLYDPTTGSFSTAPMNVDSFCGGNVQMADGRLMMIGGDHGDNDTLTSTYGPAIKSVVAYDPASATWMHLADMNRPRWYPAAVRLGDGRILAMSGQVDSVTWVDTPEVYDPQSNTWTLLNNVNTSDVHEELYPQAYLLPNGKVLVFAVSTGHTWILDVNAQTWTAGPSGSILNASTVQYQPGKILISGGTGRQGYGAGTGTGAAVLDMTAATPAWQTIAPMKYARGYHQLTPLPDGKVLAVGGSSVFSTASRSGPLPAEVWDPSSGTWTAMAAMQDLRMNHSTGMLMPDATVLAAGGGHELQTGAIDYFTAEGYSPPYLYGGTRPTITSAPASAGYGASISVQTPSPSSVASVALIGLSATTHRYDPGATYQSLPFAVGSGQLNVTMPASTNLAPPGYYMLFLVSNTGVPSVASMVQLTGTDATPPVVAATTPAGGSTGSAPTASPTATFTKPVQAGSIQFTIADSSGTPLRTTTNYNAATNTATFTLGSPLGFAKTYTATISGATDLASHPMAGPFSWSFTTASPPTCPCTIWTNSSTPTTASASDPGPLELGVKFQPEGDGYVTGVRFYKGPGNTGTHVGSLWSSTGTLLGKATFTSETATGWQNVSFPYPVPVTAGTTYVASYFAPAGGYAYDSGYFTAGGHETVPLNAMQASLVGGNGVYSYSSSTAFPTSRSSNDANYWVDVSFVFSVPPSSTPPTVSSTKPASGATGVSLSAVVSATFSAAVQPATVNFSLADGTGKAVPGTASYDGSTATSTFVPTAPLAYSTTYTATVSGATDQSGKAMAGPFSWSFTTLARPNCPCTIWSSTVTPATPASNDTSAVELGVKFRSDSDGFVTGVRFYKGAGNGGAHTGSLWTDTGSRLATATFQNEGATGWQQVTFSTAVAVTAGRTYIVSYFAPQGHYAFDSQYFSSSGVDTNPLHALRAGVAGANGVFAYTAASAFPSSGSGSSSNYWVDPIFEMAPLSGTPTVAAQTPAAGATAVSTSTSVTATFSKAVQPGSITFTLTNAAGTTVPGSLSYNGLNYTATFTPASGLSMSSTYTATVSGATDLAGTAMAAPSSWSFATTAPACPCTIWPSTATPGTLATTDGGSLELGVKFTSDINGSVTGVRFYKGSGNTGTHIGNLWSSSGQLLATATFTNETATGWQQVSFSTPVAISAGTVYVVSYFAPLGHYAYDGGYFGTSYDNAPLHALAGGNGVYQYSRSSAFPSSTSGAKGNYWVDVVLSN